VKKDRVEEQLTQAQKLGAQNDGSISFILTRTVTASKKLDKLNCKWTVLVYRPLFGDSL